MGYVLLAYYGEAATTTKVRAHARAFCAVLVAIGVVVASYPAQLAAYSGCRSVRPVAPKCSDTDADVASLVALVVSGVAVHFWWRKKRTGSNRRRTL